MFGDFPLLPTAFGNNCMSRRAPMFRMFLTISGGFRIMKERSPRAELASSKTHGQRAQPAPSVRNGTPCNWLHCYLEEAA